MFYMNIIYVECDKLSLLWMCVLMVPCGLCSLFVMLIQMHILVLFYIVVFKCFVFCWFFFF